jgi:hypothetical protein
MRMTIWIFLLAAWLVAATQAEAAMLGDAQLSFQAERTVTVDGRTYTGTLSHVPGHERHEQDLFGMHEIFLLDTKAATGFLLLPNIKTYVEFPFPALMAELDSPDLTTAPQGQETVSGIRTTKYKVDHQAKDGSHAKGFIWVSRAGQLMKLDATVTRAHGGKPIVIGMELSHVREGPQDKSLFDLPANYVKLPTEALGPLLGAKTK